MKSLKVDQNGNFKQNCVWGGRGFQFELRYRKSLEVVVPRLKTRKSCGGKKKPMIFLRPIRELRSRSKLPANIWRGTFRETEDLSICLPEADASGTLN